MKSYELNEWNDQDPIPSVNNFISTCCGANSWGELYFDDKYPPTGICSKCKDHATFEQETEE
jgi:hypothetical protein